LSETVIERGAEDALMVQEEKEKYRKRRRTRRGEKD